MSQLYIHFVEWCCKVLVHCLSSSHCLPLCCDSISYQCHFSCNECSGAPLSNIFLPFALQYMLQYVYYVKTLYYIKFLATVYGIWSLDFFRLVIPPIGLPLNTMHSIIDAFATFLLLSYIKLLNTSFSLLIVTDIHSEHGSRLGHFLYYDATIKFMGPQHLPFAILFPLLLLLLYPMQWFQKCLNK